MRKLWRSLDAIKADIDPSLNQEDQELLVRVFTSMGVLVSAGYVAWLLRGGSLLAALMSSLPLWKSLDVLPILAYRRKKKVEKDDPEEPARLDFLLVTPSGGPAP